MSAAEQQRRRADELAQRRPGRAARRRPPRPGCRDATRRAETGLGGGAGDHHPVPLARRAHPPRRPSARAASAATPPRPPGAARPGPSRSPGAGSRRSDGSAGTTGPPRPAGSTGRPRARPAATTARRRRRPRGRRRPRAGRRAAAASSRWLCGPRPCRFTATSGRPPRAASTAPVAQAADRDDVVDHPLAGQPRAECCGCGQHQARARPGPAQPAQGGDRGEQVAEPEGAQGQDRRSRPGRLRRRRDDELAQLAAGRLLQREEHGRRRRPRGR